MFESRWGLPFASFCAYFCHHPISALHLSKLTELQNRGHIPEVFVPDVNAKQKRSRQRQLHVADHHSFLPGPFNNARPPSTFAAHRSSTGFNFDAAVSEVHSFRLDWLSAAFRTVCTLGIAGQHTLIRYAHRLSLTRKSGAAVKLEGKDTLKITFQVVDKESGKGVQPHQTFLRFFDPKTNEEGIQPVRVTPGGKAKFELVKSSSQDLDYLSKFPLQNPSKPPLSIPPTPTDDPLQVSLIIGSSAHDPLSVELFDLVLPLSQPAAEHPQEAAFHVRPEIKHTFRPDPTLPPKAISFVFAAIALSPWVVLVGLVRRSQYLLIFTSSHTQWSQVAPSPTQLLSPNVLPFVLSLGAFEVLLFRYWVGLKLGQVLLYGAILAIPTVFAGKQALATIGRQRVGLKK